MDKKVYLSFDDIFADDEFNLLEVKPTVRRITEEERLVQSFQEVIDFVEEHGRIPERGNGFKERMLAARLKGLMEDRSKFSVLSAFDSLGILPVEDVLDTEFVAEDVADAAAAEVDFATMEVTSFDDLLNADPFNLLGGTDEEQLQIFDTSNLPQVDKEREKTDFVARRKRCKDFDRYEPLFKAVHVELGSGDRKYVDFKAGTLQAGTFYIHKGVIFLLESIEVTRADHYKEDGTRVRFDGRTRCIFENGTESNMYLRSVEKMLYDEGSTISHSNKSNNVTLQKNANLVNESDQESGFIYVLRSKSTDPVIRGIKNLYKIGVARNSVEDRIKNAKDEATYLMADVHLISKVTCYNLDAYKFEQLMHTFFAEVCLDLEVADKIGVRTRPREWFVAPLDVIEEAVDLFVSGEILKYRYDKGIERIVLK
ncbi:GIY-YIG nuclease family protein [Sphingobacterium siyangense]|uniref:T5orf172 domain-containing protein n=1 Tax=Sphingobacterium siyangense TaxID=459529 RepID=A0A562M238_9SPHI|nr:GIY-YIG nuclease family protein [Sphingobacterium siyangense]TWI14005.1 T5orf172 domain-containing protein [Sphingobacterium siyangense]